MVESRLELEPEVLEIFSIIDTGNNFVLSGGAGSGKTYSLVQAMKQVLAENTKHRIACITYTNAAVKEIESRIDNKKLDVSTIHEFLWENIKSFQIELKKMIVDLINDESNKRFIISSGKIDENFFQGKTIKYKEYTLLSEGIISHDEIIIIANMMFKNYTKLCDIVKDKYNFILVDEYQDSNKYVVEIFLECLKKSNRKNIIGLFGDSMQSIYDSGIGDLKNYIMNEEVKEVTKAQNRRNPRLVFELANKLRTDGIIQEPSDDINAPNMQGNVVKEGRVSFYYSATEEKLNYLKRELDWDFHDPIKTKELNLTHNLIAPKAGFSKLMDIYDNDKILSYKKRITDYIKKNNIEIDFSTHSFGEVIEVLLVDKSTDNAKKPILPTPGMKKFIDTNPELYQIALDYPFRDLKKIHLEKDLLLDDKKDEIDDESKAGTKRDNLIKHLFKIQDNISLYEEGKYNEFLRKTEFKVKSISDKRKIKKIIENLKNMSDKSIGDVIEYAHANGICMKDDKFSDFIHAQAYVYNRVNKVEFKEFQNLYNYLEGYTPFSTQHKIKGTEFDNVLVILDNGNWSNYNFEYLMNDSIYDDLPSAKKNSYSNILERTRKLFYVCCTRAKENLVVYYCNPADPVIEKAKSWFGETNVHEI